MHFGTLEQVFTLLQLSIKQIRLLRHFAVLRVNFGTLSRHFPGFSWKFPPVEIWHRLDSTSLISTVCLLGLIGSTATCCSSTEITYIPVCAGIAYVREGSSPDACRPQHVYTKLFVITQCIISMHFGTLEQVFTLLQLSIKQIRLLRHFAVLRVNFGTLSRHFPGFSWKFPPVELLCKFITSICNT